MPGQQNKCKGPGEDASFSLGNNKEHSNTMAWEHQVGGRL